MIYYHVTDVISILGDYGGVPAHILKAAALAGTETHRYALAWVHMGGAMPLTVPESVASYVDKFKEWFEDTVTEVALVPTSSGHGRKPATELRLNYEAWGVTGKIDLIAKIKGDKSWSLLDLKRVAVVQKITGLQLAGYKRIVESQLHFKIGRRLAVHIPPDGPCRTIEFSNPQDEPAFVNALFLYKYLHSIEAVKPRE